MPSRRGDPRTSGEWKRLRARLVELAVSCAACGAPLVKDGPARGALSPSVDHVVSLSRGGAPYDVGNLRVVHARCNTAKENRSRRRSWGEVPPWRSRNWYRPTTPTTPSTSRRW
jgi:hypothetical protein